LDADSILFVPRYLMQRLGDQPGCGGYGLVRYSRSIRPIRTRTYARLDLQSKSSVTAVLPDHFYAGVWDCFEELLPLDSDFIVCSDGFYTCFPYPEDIWNWLAANRAGLHDEAERDGLLASLHRRLHGRSGDDDISFVWVRDMRAERGSSVAAGAVAQEKGES
jgi:hypothetical protein